MWSVDNLATLGKVSGGVQYCSDAMGCVHAIVSRRCSFLYTYLLFKNGFRIVSVGT